MDDTRRPRLAARALWVCALLALIAASVLGVALPADEAAAQVLGGRNFRLTSQGGGQVQLSWSTGSGQTAYRLNRITSAGTVVVAPSLASTATSFTDSLGTSVNVACYQLEILGTGNAVIGTSDILCVIVNVVGGVSPPRNVSITTNESPIITIGWQAPTAGNQIGYLVVPLGRAPLAFLPANATQAVDAPGVPTCYIVLTLIPDSAQVPFRIGGFSDIVCAIPGVFTPLPPVQATATATRTNTTVPLTPTGVDLTIAKVAQPNTVAPGGTVTYTLTVSNLGGTAASGVTVDDQVPNGMTFVTSSGTNGFVCNHAAGVVACAGGTIAGNSSATITMVLVANNPCVVLSPVLNVARVDPSNTIAETNEANNTASAVVTITGCPTATGTAGTVTVTGTPPPSVTGTQIVTPTGTATFTPANVVVSKVDSPDPVVAGDNLTYTITVTNLGQSPTGPLFLTDSLPAGLTYLVASGNQSFVCNEVQNTVSCSSPNLPGGQSAVISLLVRADNPCVVVSPVTNVVRTEIGGPPDAQSPSATQQTTILGCVQGTSSPTITRTPTPTGSISPTVTTTATPGVDLTINKIDIPDPVVPPNSLQYTLVVQNLGSVAANNISVVDDLPVGGGVDWTFGSASGEAGFVCTYNAIGNTVTCTGGNIGPNGGATISIVLNFLNCGSQYYVNTATVDPANTIAEFNENNNTVVSQTACGAGVATATPFAATQTPTRTATGIPTTVPTTTFSFLKLDAPDPVLFGGSITYTLRLTNTGGNAISGVTLQDNLPAEVTFQQVTSTGGGFVCSFLGAPTNNGIVQCSNGTVPANSTVDINIVVAVTTCVSPIVNTATIITPPVANNVATQTTTVANCATVTPTVPATATVTATGTPATLNIGPVTKTGAPLTGTTGQTFTYTINLPVTGTGTATWTAAQRSVIDTLPAGLVTTALPGSDFGAVCSIVGQTVTCTGGSIPAGSTGQVTIPVQITGCGTLINTATADPDNVVGETSELDNQATATTTNTCDTELLKEQTAPAGNVVNTAGGAQNVTYTLTLNDIAAGQTNVAPSTVTDTLPAGFVVQGVPTVSGGDTGTCTVTGQTVTCTNVGGPEPVTITIVAQVPTTVARGNYTDTATATTPNDVNAANNTSTVTTTVYPFDVAVDVTCPDQAFADYVCNITVTNTSAGGVAANNFFVNGGLAFREPPGGPGSFAGNPAGTADLISVVGLSPGVTCTFPSISTFNDHPRYSCSVSTLPAGSTAFIQVQVDHQAAEDDVDTRAISLDATLHDQPVGQGGCFGGGTDPSGACAPETIGFTPANPPDAAKLVNNRDVAFVDQD